MGNQLAAIPAVKPTVTACGMCRISEPRRSAPMRWLASHVYFHKRGSRGLSFAEFEVVRDKHHLQIKTPEQAWKAL